MTAGVKLRRRGRAGRAFVDTMQRRFVRDVALAPLGGRDFASFHPQTQRSTHVRFDGPPEARTVSILNGQQAVVATRVARP